MAPVEPSELKTIHQQLAQFSRLTVPPVLPETEAANIRAALLQFSDLADYETIGVCADDLAAAVLAMEAYVAALCRPIQLDLEPRIGPVFIKFNTLKGMWYLDGYTGTSRGVLVSFHTSEPDFDRLNGTYGPFPLNLFG